VTDYFVDAMENLPYVHFRSIRSDDNESYVGIYYCDEYSHKV